MANPAPAVDPADAAAEAAFADRNKMLTATPPVDPKADAAADAAAEAAFSGRPAATAATGDQSWGPTLRGLPYQFGQGLIEGGAGLLGAPAGIAHGINRLFGIPAPVEDPALGFQNTFTPSDLLSKAQGTGYYDPTQPDTLTGQVVRGLGQSTPALALGPLGGLGMKANAAYTYLPSAVGDIFHHYTDQNPLWASLPSALTLSGAERMITQAGVKTAATRTAEKAAADAAAAKAAQKAHEAQGPAFTRGLQEQQDVSQAQAGRGKMITEADAAKRHDSEITAADTHLQAEHAGADADRETMASQFGTSNTLVQGAGVMQDKARKWLGTEFKPALNKAEDGMWYKDPADHSQGTLIPQDAEGDATHLKSSIEHSYVTGAGVEGEPIASMFRSRLPEAVNAKLDALAAKQGKPPGTAPTFTFADLRNIRSAIGDALGDPSVISSIGVKKLNEMYRGVNDDIRAAISNSAGSEGLAAFDKFNKEATRLFGVAGTVGDNIVTTTNVGKETITPQILADNNGLWNDNTKISQLRSEKTLNEGVNEVAASKLRAGGRDAETAYDKLPEARTAMFGQQESALDTIKARRAAAESTATNAKTAADKDLADMRAAAAKQSAASLKGAEASRQDLRQGRSEAGISLKQEAEAREAALKEAQAKMKDVHTAKPMSWENIPWGRVLAGLGGLTSGHHLLPQELASQLPNWGQHAVDLGTAAAAYVAARGAHEMIHNPQARKNLLQAGTITAGTRPDALGWGLGENK